MTSSPTAVQRLERRRAAVVEEALDHAVDVMTALGVGGLTVSEVARRMGIRPPSLYKYFDSLHAMYDALYARGVAGSGAAVDAATAGIPAGRDRLRAGMVAIVRWSMEHPALAQLVYWRPVPGFEPSSSVFAASVEQVRGVRGELADAVAAGELAPSADSDEAVRLLTVLLAGVISQQLANEPGADYATGRFATLTDQVVDLFLAHHAQPAQPASPTH